MGHKRVSKGKNRQEQRRRERKILNSIGDVLTGKIPNVSRRHYGDGLTRNDVQVDKGEQDEVA